MQSGALDRRGVEHWRQVYDTTGIRHDSPPPVALSHVVSAATHVLSSDMPRALQSAVLLAPQRPVKGDAVFREAALSIPDWPTRLPLRVWGTIIYLGWQFRTLLGRPDDAHHRQRAAVAAAQLAALVQDGSSACVITHGVFRTLLSRELHGLGWTMTERRGGYSHWSSWHFVRTPRFANPLGTQ
jgi:broad specificity phosphatase PhoE